MKHKNNLATMIDQTQESRVSVQVKVEQGDTQRQRTVVVVVAAAEAVVDAGNLRMRHIATVGTLRLHIPTRRIVFICPKGTRQGGACVRTGVTTRRAIESAAQALSIYILYRDYIYIYI